MKNLLFIVLFIPMICLGQNNINSQDQSKLRAKRNLVNTEITHLINLYNPKQKMETKKTKTNNIKQTLFKGLLPDNGGCFGTQTMHWNDTTKTTYLVCSVKQNDTTYTIRSMIDTTTVTVKTKKFFKTKTIEKYNWINKQLKTQEPNQDKAVARFGEICMIISSKLNIAIQESKK